MGDFLGETLWIWPAGPEKRKKREGQKSFSLQILLVLCIQFFLGHLQLELPRLLLAQLAFLPELALVPGHTSHGSLGILELLVDFLQDLLILERGVQDQIGDELSNIHDELYFLLCTTKITLI